MFDTPLFRARCNAYLTYLAVIGKISLDNVREDESDVLSRLLTDKKVRVSQNGTWEPFVYPINAEHYPNDGYNDSLPFDPWEGRIHPLVLSLAAESEENEEFLRIYRKNNPHHLTEELAADTI